MSFSLGDRVVAYPPAGGYAPKKGVVTAVLVPLDGDPMYMVDGSGPFTARLLRLDHVVSADAGTVAA